MFGKRTGDTTAPRRVPQQPLAPAAPAPAAVEAKPAATKTALANGQMNKSSQRSRSAATRKNTTT